MVATVISFDIDKTVAIQIGSVFLFPLLVSELALRLFVYLFVCVLFSICFEWACQDF